MKFGFLVLLPAAVLAAAPVFAAQAKNPISGKWRITRAVIAPWGSEAEAGPRPGWIGETVEFGRSSVKAPGPLACGSAQYQATDVPPDGLFQGGLPAPAAETMKPLGLAGEKIAGVSLACDTGVFEFHFAAAESLLLALDNRIWTLDRTVGARAEKSSPEGVVQRFLEAHFAGDMGFVAATVEAKKDFFSSALSEKVDRYFAKPQDPNEAPAVNGDPFTDTQEYPTRFAVRGDDKKIMGVEVQVEFADAYHERAVIFDIVREKARWAIDDLRYEDGTSLGALLAR